MKNVQANQFYTEMQNGMPTHKEEFFFEHFKTRTVRGSDYSPAKELSEQKDKLVTATGDIEKYSEKQANKVWLNSVEWFSRY